MYLSKISISNYRGIKHLTASFNPKLNVIIGENGSHKSALIDAIRLLYNVGEQQRSIFVSDDDFYIEPVTKEPASTIEISYEFLGLTDEQKGAYNAFLVCSVDDVSLDYLKVNLTYESRKGRSPSFSYYTGADAGQKAEIKNFELFQHYYLSPLRNSTRDLLNNKGNVLSNLLMRRISENGTQQSFENIVIKANEDLLGQPEIKLTKTDINNNLEKIFQKYPENKVGLQIERSKVDNVINLIKPYLPFDVTQLAGEGFSLEQNSLGFNNLIYIAIVLGDIEQRTDSNKNYSHFALLIEEPEVHLHPQLLLSLFNFLNATNISDNSQLFITSHSPTLTSKVPLDNLILLDNEKAFLISNCFLDRVKEQIIQDTSGNTSLTVADFRYRKKQLERYIDVTRSQLFYAKGILLIEGISEEMLVPAFCQILGYKVEDFRLEIVNADGVSFYAFLCLFNSSDELKRLPKKVAILSDDDRYTDSKEAQYSFNKLFENNYAVLNELNSQIKNAHPSRRIQNLESFSNHSPSLAVKAAYKTFEFEISRSNVADKKSQIESNLYVKYIQQVAADKFVKIRTFYQSLPNDVLSEDEKNEIAILLWKTIPAKADFAQDFSIYLLEHLTEAQQSFTVPLYVVEALHHLTN